MITIDSIYTPVSRHQRNGIFWLQSSFMDGPSGRLRWRIWLLCFFVLDKFDLYIVSVLFTHSKIKTTYRPEKPSSADISNMRILSEFLIEKLTEILAHLSNVGK